VLSEVSSNICIFFLLGRMAVVEQPPYLLRISRFATFRHPAIPPNHFSVLYLFLFSVL